MFKKIVVVSLIALPLLSLAQVTAFPPVNAPVSSITSLSAVNRVIVNIVNWVMGLFFVAAVLFIFYAAYLFLNAAGNPDQLQHAKDQLIYAIVAIVVALLAGSVRFIVASVLQ